MLKEITDWYDQTALTFRYSNKIILKELVFKVIQLEYVECECFNYKTGATDCV